MFDDIDKLSYYDALDVIHYINLNIGSPDLNKSCDISDENKIIAIRILRSKEIRRNPQKALRVLHEKLQLKAQLEKYVNNESAEAALQRISKKKERIVISVILKYTRNRNRVVARHAGGS